MSIRVMTRVWDEAQGVTGTELLVLLALADNANDEGVCWPSRDLLATKTRTSVATVKRAIRSLIEEGYLSVEDQPGRPNRYTVHFPPKHEPQFPTEEQGAQSDPGQSDPGRGVRMTQGGVTAMTRGSGHSYDPRTVREPSGTVNTPDEPGEQLLIQGEGPDTSDGFDAWWAAYPRKDAKEAARSVYRRALRKPGVSPGFLAEQLRRQVGWWQAERREAKYIPQARTWLSQGRYTDEMLQREPPQPQRQAWDDVKWVGGQ